jgi:hypothetical protein
MSTLVNVAAVGLVLAGSPLDSTPRVVKIAAAQATITVQGAQVEVTAQWNEARDGTGIYQAPEGFEILSARPIITSEARSSSSVVVSADRREARLTAHVRGSGEFWNKSRGWFNGYLEIEQIRKP